MAESGIFGQTPAAIRAAMAQERLGNASLIGRMGPGGHGALAGLALGQGVAGMFGAEDPRLKQAQELQNIEREISQMGLEPGTPEFTRETVGRIRSRLGEQAAIQAWQMAVQLEQQRAEVEAVRNGPAAEQAKVERRIGFLRRLGLPADIAFNDKIFEKVVGEVMTEKSPDRIRVLRELQGDPALMRTAKELARAGGVNVNQSVNSFKVPAGYMVSEGGAVTPIPGGPKDPTTLSPGEASKARDEARKLDSGITAVSQILESLSAGGPPIMPGNEKTTAKFLRGEMISALAAMRGLGVLQPAELEFLSEQIPEVTGIEAALKQGMDPKALTGPLSVFLDRAIEARGRLRLPPEEARTSGKDVSEMTDEELEAGPVMATREEARRELARRELARRRGVPVSELLEQIRQSGPKAKPQAPAMTRFSRAAIGGGANLMDLADRVGRFVGGEPADEAGPPLGAMDEATRMGITDPSSLTAGDLPSTLGRQVVPSLIAGAARPAALGAELVSGLGGGLGEFVGRQAGGNVGALVGGLGGSLTGAGVAGGAQALLGGSRGAQANQALRAATGAPVGLGEAGGTGFARFLERVSARIPGGSLVARRRATTIALKVANRAEGVGQRLTQAVDPEIAGGAIREGFDVATEVFKRTSKALYMKSRVMSGGQTVVPAHYASAVNRLKAEADRGASQSAGAFNKSGGDLIDDVWTRLQSDMATGPNFHMAKLEAIRTRIGAELGSVDVIGTPREGTLKLLYGALSKDMRTLANKAGPKALKAFESANGHYEGGLKTLKRLHRAIVNKQTDSQIFSAMFNKAGQGPEILRDLKAKIPAKEWDMAVGMVLRRMGRETPGATTVVEAGDAGFSLSRFLTNWAKFNDAGNLKVLFDGRSAAMQGVRKDLTQIAKVAAGSRQLFQSLPNPPNTAEVTVATAGIAGAVGGASLGFLPEVIKTMAAVTGSGVGIQALLQSPRFIGWLATSTRIPVGQLPAHMERLERVIQEEPQSAALAQGIIDELKP